MRVEWDILTSQEVRKDCFITDCPQIKCLWSLWKKTLEKMPLKSVEKTLEKMSIKSVGKYPWKCPWTASESSINNLQYWFQFLELRFLEMIRCFVHFSYKQCFPVKTCLLFVNEPWWLCFDDNFKWHFILLWI
jgi:hypothetical protein